MSKAVLISIKPEWCELIALGAKTIEIRKTKPKLEMPFKCYIYCTEPKRSGDIFLVGGEHPVQGNGKVIGEFVCDRIHRIAIIDDECVDVVDCNTACLSSREILDYANGNPLYGWHISDLVIYDEPRELSDFFVKGFCSTEECEKCKYHDGIDTWCLLPPSCDDEGIKPLFKAPQSWCYVEESDNV